MEIQFHQKDLNRLDYSLSRDWIEINPEGYYASSSITGINTRRKHGLFVIPGFGNKYHVILSHLQEEVFYKEVRYPLFNVEYENHLETAGLKWLVRFEQGRFPAFVYEFPDMRLVKSLILLSETNQLILSYRIEGENLSQVRMIIRPFFAFRSIEDSAGADHFNNKEVFLMDKQFRYLPDRDAQEIFMQFSEGQFINSPTLYQKFLYRKESSAERIIEDLITPGFFEVSFQETNQLFLAASLREDSGSDLEGKYVAELERRKMLESTHESWPEEARYFYDKLQNFRRIYSEQMFYYTSDIFRNEFILSLHCFIVFKLLKSGLNSSDAKALVKQLIHLLDQRRLQDLFMGLDSKIRVEAVSPFMIVITLYYYHLLYDKSGEMSEVILNTILEIIDLIRKNKLPFFRLKMGKLLERQYRQSDINIKNDYQVFFPIRQNFMINVFWFNMLHMAVELGDKKNMKMLRYKRWAKKIKNNIQQKYIKNFMADPVKAPQNYPFAFHPSMILAITLPFSVLDPKQAQIFYRILIKQFLDKNGIKFPVNPGNPEEFIVSPILVAEFMTGWMQLMKEKDFLLNFYNSVARNFNFVLKNGTVGYIPNQIGGDERVISKPSGVATAEMIFFYSQMSKYIEPKQNDVS
ncbi:MAG: glycogen debranching enzyme family protein [Calditrichaeota bacterium]|nr:glycogen debranching enzyme family protein [Calditrichota bacterium]